MKNFLIFLFFFLFLNFYIVFGNNINIPEIILEIQSGLEETGDGLYKCKNTKCKINLNLEKIFSGSYKQANYNCLWDFGGGNFSTTGTNEKCNPGYVDYGTGEFDLSVKVLDKTNDSNFKEKIFKIFNIIESVDKVETNTGIIENLDENTNSGVTVLGLVNSGTILDIPEIILEIQSGLEETGTGIYKCKNTQCKINLNLEKIFSGSYKQANYNCLWDFGGGNFSTIGTDKKCNPGYINYGTGEFDLSVKVLDKTNDSNFKEKIFKIFNVIEIIAKVETNTGIVEKLDENTNSGNINFGDTNSGNFIKLPDVIFNFQNPSYILDSDKDLKKYFCDYSKSECKINLDLRNSFTGSFLEKDFLCEIDFGFGSGNLTGEENKCNPNTIIFGDGNFNINFKIIAKTNSGYYSTGGLIIENNQVREIKTNTVSGVSGKRNKYEEKQNIVLKNIEIQSGLKLNSLSKSYCDKEICSINLIYENDNQNLLCNWDFGNGDFTTIGTDKKCNPGYVKYSIGKHKIKLKIYDKNYNDNFKEIYLEFENIGSNLNSLLDIDKVPELLDGDRLNDIVFNFDKLKNIRFGNISVNPKGSDTLEYIELINKNNDVINLKGCFLDDKLDGGSKKYVFIDDYFIFPNSRKRIYKSKTKLNLNNNGDEINLFCGSKNIDKIKWNFTVKSGFLITHENTEIKNGEAIVINVIDGDTIIIKFENGNVEKLRLIGIDTPETKDPRKPVQFFGIEASNYTNSKLLGKQIYLEIDPENYRDKYSRLLGYIYLDGKSFNKDLVENGYAKVYDKFPFKYLQEYKKAEIYSKKNKLGMWEFINIDLESKVFEKYKEDVKYDLEFQKLEEKLEFKFEKLKKEKKFGNEYYELIEDIDLLYSKNEKEYIGGIPNDFLEYRKVNLLEKKIISHLIYSKNKETDINLGDKNIFDKLLKDKLLKYKIIGDEVFVLNEKVSQNNYNYFVNNGFKINVSKLKSGLKIYGNSLSNSEVRFNYKDIFYKLKSDDKGNFELKISDLEKIKVGDFTIKPEVIDKFGNKFKIEKNKNFNVSKTYILDLKLISLEKKYNDEIQTLNYLEKDLVSLAKDFEKIIKKNEKEIIKKLKKNNNKIQKKTKLPGDKLNKIQIYEKEKEYEKTKNNNGIFYYFLIIVFSLTLIFILLKREKII